MRFLIRSAFWLILAFLVMRPGHVDLDGAAEAISSHAVAAGQQALIEHMSPPGCGFVDCVGSVGAIASAMGAGMQAPAAIPKQPEPVGDPDAPVPRPRLERSTL